MSMNDELKAAFAAQKTTEVCTAVMGDLSVLPEMQMRRVMNHEVVSQYAEVVHQLPPVDVFEVQDVDRLRWYLVDGFHRYFAHEEAGLKEIDIILHKNVTYEDAFNFAMTQNFKNGQQPTKEDRERVVAMMYEHLEAEIGLDSKKVVPALMERGLPRQTADRYTKELRKRLDTQRDHKITELLGEGMSEIKIAKAVGCSKGTVGNVKKGIEASAQNCSLSENGQQEPDLTPEEQELYDMCEVDEEEEDEFAAKLLLHVDEVAERQAKRDTKSSPDETSPNTVVSDTPTSVDAAFVHHMKALIEIMKTKRKYTAQEIEKLKQLVNMWLENKMKPRVFPNEF